MSTFHSTATFARTRPTQPNLVVGWASGLVQVWPAEDSTIDWPASSPSEHELIAS